jgi:hypothetical protein
MSERLEPVPEVDRIERQRQQFVAELRTHVARVRAWIATWEPELTGGGRLDGRREWIATWEPGR